MEEYKICGKKIREDSKALVLDFMLSSVECQKDSDGVKLSELFRACGFDWGEYPNATSSHQQYWCVALARELEKENKIERLASKKWRLF